MGSQPSQKRICCPIFRQQNAQVFKLLIINTIQVFRSVVPFS